MYPHLFVNVRRAAEYATRVNSTAVVTLRCGAERASVLLTATTKAWHWFVHCFAQRYLMFMHSNKAARVRYERCGDKCSRNHASHNFHRVPVIVTNEIIRNIGFILGVCHRQNRFLVFYHVLWQSALPRFAFGKRLASAACVALPHKHGAPASGAFVSMIRLGFRLNHVTLHKLSNAPWAGLLSRLSCFSPRRELRQGEQPLA